MRGASIVISLLYVLFLVWISTTLTCPSCPGFTLVTHPSGHLLMKGLSSLIMTIANSVPLVALIQRRKVLWVPPPPKCLTSCWHSFHLLKSVMSKSGGSSSGMAVIGRLMRKCPGMRGSTPSSLADSIRVSGRLFMQASTCVRTVTVKLIILVTLFSWCLPRGHQSAVISLE